MSNSFADSLKSFRAARGLSQQQLAELLYVDRSTVANWESGRRVPNALQITNIASALGIDVGTLMNSASTVSKAPPPYRLLSSLLTTRASCLRGKLSTLNEHSLLPL